ncbi:MAG TPA: hypothetical protein VHR42_01975 [Clostridia bacterium]|nr:hypothetical protein [Clostridia bacterium]
MKLSKVQCPYCGKKLGLTAAWILRTQGEYHCPDCGAYSNIEMSGGIYLLAVIAAILSAGAFLVQLVLVRSFSWLSLAVVCIPFILFFLASPFFVRLQKPAVRRRRPSPPQASDTQNFTPPNASPGNPADSDRLERTIVMRRLK